jgi:hypothetical protein
MSTTEKFRPQYMSGRYKLRVWRLSGKNPNYNWMPRNDPPIKLIYKIGGRLHYLADHAPLPIQKRWKPVFDRFCRKYPKF